MKLTACILAWDTRITTLESICILEKDLKNIDHDFVIVDNGSNDGLCEEDIRDICKRYTYVRNSKNRGISIGKNQCIDFARGDYVLLLDGDVVPVPNSVNCLIDWMDEHKPCHAIGFLPNKFSQSRNKQGQLLHEEYCNNLFDVHEHKGACLYYGLYRRLIFDTGLRMSTEDVFGEEGYGWEDHDFFEKMKSLGIKQYSCAVNHVAGRYFHEINSSIRVMGREKYLETSRTRGKYFKKKWGNKNAAR